MNKKNLRDFSGSMRKSDVKNEKKIWKYYRSRKKRRRRITSE